MELEYLVVVPFYWGRGNTIDEAKKKVRKEGYGKGFPRAKTWIYAFPKGAQPFVSEIGSIRWKGRDTDLMIIQSPTKTGQPEKVNL